MTKKQIEQQKARTRLLDVLKEGDILYTVVVHVARSRMCRDIKVLAVVDGKIEDISGLVSELLQWRWMDNGSVRVNGCGMDIPSHLIQQIGGALGLNLINVNV